MCCCLLLYMFCKKSRNKITRYAVLVRSFPLLGAYGYPVKLSSFVTMFLGSSSVTKKCEPPDVTMALSKDPRSATIKIVTKENRLKFFDVVASLDPECNPQQVMYSWEGAKVDKELGMFVSPPYPLHKESTTRPELKLRPFLLQPYGLYYIRCLTSYHRLSTSKYDYGFLETVFMRPFRCEITPIQGKAILERFTLNCSRGYDGKSPTSYSIKFNSSSGPVDVTNWRSPSDAIRLPAGNLVDDYSVQLKVEANFPPLPPLHTHVAVKVCIQIL